MCLACIVEDDPESDRQKFAADLNLQAQMVRSLAAQADTILIALAVEETVRWRRVRVVFRINRVLKGQIPASGEVSYTTLPGVVPLCPGNASQTFLNTNAGEGETYILYSRKGELLRAGNIARHALPSRPAHRSSSRQDISLEEEIKLVMETRGI